MASEKKSDKSWWHRVRRRKNGRSFPFLPIKRVSASRLLLFCATFVAIWLAMTPPSLLVPVPFVEGQTFPYDIRAYRTVRYLSEVATEQRRQLVAQAVPRRYRLDPSVAARWEAVLNELMDAAASLHATPLPLSEKIQRLRDRIGISLPDQVLSILVRTSPSTLRVAQSSLLQSLRAEWQRGIKPLSEEQAAALQRVKERIDNLPLTNDVKWALKRCADTFLQPNMVFDPVATEQARQRARASVEPVWRTITAGELIARRGEVVTEEHLEKLRALGSNVPALLGTTFLALLFTLAVAFFLRFALAEIFADTRRLSFLALLWLPSLLLVRFLFPLVGTEIAFLVVASVAIVTAVLVRPLFSSIASILFALTTSLGMSMDWQVLPTGALRPFLVSAGLGVAAAFVAANARTRTQLVQGGVLLSALTIFLSFLLGLVTGETLTLSWGDYQRLFLWAALVGFVPPALVLSGIGLLERPFGVTTVFTLTELANPNTPLLRELAERAPGTFQSSLMVARLAQEAARRIGANELLAWVGGLYHDIGKLMRPEYFVENQAPGTKNPHTRLGPKVSALVLDAHVRDGVELAKEHRLPQPVIDIIAEHHGNSLMTYFWAKAQEQEQGQLDADYRYRGQKPRSKESALVMLADSVEAAVRSLPNPDLERVREIIDEVVDSKVADGQLDDSPLSFREVQEIKKAFWETFKSIYHQRIEYPKAVEQHGKANQRAHNGAQEPSVPPSPQRAQGQTEASH